MFPQNEISHKSKSRFSLSLSLSLSLSRSRKNHSPDKLDSRSALTLVELLIYVAIFAIVAGLFVGILTTTVQSNNQEVAANEVTGQLNFVLSTVQRLVQNSSQVEVYASLSQSTSTNATTTGSFLKIRTNSTSTDPTCVYLSNGTVYQASGKDPTNQYACNLSNAVALTTSKVVANSLDFNQYNIPGGHTSVQLNAELTYNSTNPQFEITRALQSAIGRVSAATFDSDLLPNQNNTFNVGSLTNSQEWANGYFAGNVTVGTGATGGDLGVGTTNPGANLSISKSVSGGDVDEWIFNTATSTNSRAYVLVGSDSKNCNYAYLAQHTDTNDFEINNYCHSAININSSGYVGIGTSTPPAKLFVQGAGTGLADPGFNGDDVAVFSGNPNSLLHIQYNPSGGSAGLLFSTPTTRGQGSIRYNSAETDLMAFYTADSGSAALSINSSGYVGINTISQTHELAVSPNGTDYGQSTALITARSGGNDIEWGHANSAGYGSVIGAETGGGQPFVCFDCEAGSISNTFKTRGMVGFAILNLLNGVLDFDGITNSNADNQTPTVLMTLNSSGNVNIGSSGAGNVADVQITTNGGSPIANRLIYGTDGSGWKFAISKNQGGTITDQLTIQDNGNVGIGTTSPNYKLQVGTSGDGTVAEANAWNTFSDIRYKKDVQPISNALEIVQNLQGVSFEWKKDNQPSLGFVAQQVQKVLPQIVSTDPQGYESLDYSKITPVLVEAVKEQQKEITAQQSEINSLKSIVCPKGSTSSYCQ